MSVLDTLKNLFTSTAKNAASDQVTGLLKELVGKLEGLASEGNLAEAASKAVSAFKPYLEKIQGKEISADDFLGKAKTFIGSLTNVELPSEISGIVDTVKGLLGK